MLAQQLSKAIEATPVSGLDELSRLVWKAYSAGHLADVDAGRLAEAIHHRRAQSGAGSSYGGRSGGGSYDHGRTLFGPVRGYQRSPDRQRSIARRRQLAASGPMPPAMACQFTTGENAVLKIVADEVRVRGLCDRSLDEIAARAGCCRRLAQGALRQAERLGLLTITERPRHRQKHLPNLVRIISLEWTTWLARGRRSGGIGCRKDYPSGNKAFEKKGESGSGSRNGRDLRTSAAEQATPGATGRWRRR